MIFELEIRNLSTFLEIREHNDASAYFDSTYFERLFIFNYLVLVLLNSVLYVLELCDLKADHSIVLLFPPSTGFCFNKTGRKCWS